MRILIVALFTVVVLSLQYHFGLWRNKLLGLIIPAIAAALFAAADQLRAQGQRVQLRQTAPEAGSVGRIVRLTGGEVTEVG